MAQVAAPPTEVREESYRPGRGPIDWLGGWRTCIVGCIAFLVLAIAIRIFQQFTAWTVGIDASSKGFGQTYRALYYSEVLAATIGTLETEVAKSREYLDRVQRQDQQLASGALDLESGAAPGTPRGLR